MLVAFLLFFPAFTAQAKDFEFTDAYALVNNQKIVLLKNTQEDDYRLFLPACTDFSCVKLFMGDREYNIDCRGDYAKAGGTGIRIFRGSLPSLFVTLSGGNGELSRIGKSKSEVASGSVTFLGIDGKTIYSGPLDKMWSHGNSSFYPSSDASVKNSYNLKLGKKAELVSGSGKLKKYVLISPRRKDKPYDRDTTGMAQLSAFEVFSALSGGKREDVKGMFVDLYVNGEYRGFYVLAERINNGGALDLTELDDFVAGAKEAFVKIDRSMPDSSDTAIGSGIECYSYSENATVLPGTDITGGYVLEVTCGDSYVGCGFKTSLGTLVNIKYPDYCSREMVMYIATRFQEFENAICSETGYYNGKHFSEYGDLNSLADQILTYAFFLNFEIYQTSTYIYKDAGDVPLTFGPCWDFESSAKELATSATFFDTVFTYYSPVKCAFLSKIWKWGEFMKLIDEENMKMSAIIESMIKKGSVLYDHAASVAESVKMNAARWDDAVLTYTAYDYINAISARYSLWQNEFWNQDKYLIYTETEIAENPDGTVTISLKRKGTGTRPVWRVITNGTVKIFRTGVYSITVPSDGKLYMCSVQGKLNAYYRRSVSEFFRSVEFEMTTYPATAKKMSLPMTDAVTDEPATRSSPVQAIVVTSVAVIAAASVILFILIIKKRSTKKTER